MSKSIFFFYTFLSFFTDEIRLSKRTTKNLTVRGYKLDTRFSEYHDEEYLLTNVPSYFIFNIFLSEHYF